jgi:hypothetical protein
VPVSEPPVSGAERAGTRGERTVERTAAGARAAGADALYAPLRAHLDERGADEREIDFFVRARIRLAKWVADGEALLDRRKWPHSIDELARKHLVPAWTEGDRTQLAKGIAAVYEAFRNVKDFLKAGVTPLVFGEWLFSTDHILLQYGLKFDGTDLDHLSPGARASRCFFCISRSTRTTRGP